MRFFSIPTKRFAALLMVALLPSCVDNSDLNAFRRSIPEQISGLTWPGLAPIGRFEPRRANTVVPDPRSLAQRAADLRVRSRGLIGPVLDPTRARAMRTAWQRHNQG